MPIYILSDDLVFPPADRAEEGIVAIGGDLSADRLLLAYRSGIFPWFSKGEPIVWWSPDPRFVLFPAELKVSRSMAQLLRNRRFQVTFDCDFRHTITECARRPRPGQPGTWITPGMLEAYTELHRLGHAHSVEIWREGRQVGGLYGVALGRVFFGESMFFKESNASKFGFIILVRELERRGFLVIDCQVETAHLESLGARHIPRRDFLELVRRGVALEGYPGTWLSWTADEAGAGR